MSSCRFLVGNHIEIPQYKFHHFPNSSFPIFNLRKLLISIILLLFFYYYPNDHYILYHLSMFSILFHVFYHCATLLFINLLFSEISYLSYIQFSIGCGKDTVTMSYSVLIRSYNYRLFNIFNSNVTNKCFSSVQAIINLQYLVTAFITVTNWSSPCWRYRSRSTSVAGT